MRSEYPCMTNGLRNAEKLMRLQAQSPARMRQTIGECGARVRLALRAVHRLQEKLPKRESGVALGLAAGLRIDQLELVARGDDERCFGLRTHAEPVDARRRRHG